MRRLGLSERDVEKICANPDLVDEDSDGRLRFTAVLGRRRFRVVVAVDNSDVVVTVHERRN